MQIDWLSGYTSSSVKEYHAEPIWTPARFVKVSPQGEVISETPTLTNVVGSFEASMSWGSNSGREIYLSGNPVKFIQGHNLFGSCDPLALYLSAGWQLRMHGGEFPSPDTWDGLALELPTFTRIDLTRSYRFSTQGDALKWIRQVAATAHTSRMKRGVAGSSTVLFGMGSRRWSYKIYAKLDELLSPKKGHGIPAAIGRRAIKQLHEWAEGVVRFELTLRGLELKRLSGHLQRMGDLVQVQQLWQLYHDRIQFNRNAEASRMDDFKEDLLTPSEKVTLAAWRGGADLQDMLSRSEWYRRRKEILEKVGVDIAESPGDNAVESVEDLDPAGWDPEPIRKLMHDPEPVARQYLLKRAS